jgi:outer membrane protein OmpA-like peptidoglycan-associated protein
MAEKMRQFWQSDTAKKIDPNAETAELKAEIMKRLAALVGPYKEAIASNGSDVEKLKELFAAVKTALGKRQFAQAVEALDALERLLAQQKAPSGVAGLDTGRVDAGGSEPAGPAGPGKHCPPDGALESTSTIIYFCWDSADLTPSARKSLDDYAKAYLEAKSTSEVSVDGYASTDGDDQHNKKLALKRAKAVADYLSQKGVKAKQPQGHPETDEFSKDDPRQNRRAMLSPAPPKAKAPTGGTGSFSMRNPKPVGKKDKQPNLNVPDKIKDQILNEKPKAPKPTTKDEFVTKVTDFLKELAKRQGSSDGKVTSTDKVWQVDMKVNQGLGGPRGPTKRGGEGGRYDPGKLAEQITKDLPDPVPEELVKGFPGKLRPTDEPVDLTLKDHLHKKWKEVQGKIHKFIDDLPILPKKAKDFLKEKFDEAVKKGAEWILDQAMGQVNLPEEAKKKLKEYYQKHMKEIMEGKDADKDKK